MKIVLSSECPIEVCVHLCPIHHRCNLYPYSALKYVDPPLKKVLGRVIIFVDVQCGPTTTFLSTVPSWGSVVLLLPASPKHYSLYSYIFKLRKLFNRYISI